MKIIACLLTSTVMLLSSCTTDGSRLCPAFGTELADQWSTALNPGDTVSFVGDTGEVVSMVMQSRVDSEPYEGWHRDGPEAVVCRTESVRQYVFSNRDVSLLLTIAQDLGIDPLDEGQVFTLRVRPESPVGDNVGFDFLFFLSEQSLQLYPSDYDADGDSEEASPQASRLIENFEAGGKVYDFAIERKFEDLTPVQNAVSDSASLAAITRVVVAEGGLIQFEKLNGEIFSRQ